MLDLVGPLKSTLTEILCFSTDRLIIKKSLEVKTGKIYFFKMTPETISINRGREFCND